MTDLKNQYNNIPTHLLKGEKIWQKADIDFVVQVEKNLLKEEQEELGRTLKIKTKWSKVEKIANSQ